MRSREINDAALALHAASRENTALADHLLECKDLAGDPLEPLEPIPETIEDLAARELGWGDNASE